MHTNHGKPISKQLNQFNIQNMQTHRQTLYGKLPTEAGQME